MPETPSRETVTLANALAPLRPGSLEYREAIIQAASVHSPAVVRAAEQWAEGLRDDAACSQSLSRAAPLE